MSYKPVNILIQCRAWDSEFFLNMIKASRSYDLTIEQRLRVSEGFLERFKILWDNGFISMEFPDWNKKMAEKYKPKEPTKREKIDQLLKELQVLLKEKE